MSKVVDDRITTEIEVESITFKPNMKRVDEEGTVTYVVLTTLIYWKLDADGNRLRRDVGRHDLYPLSNPITSVQFINNLATLAPLAKTAALADRDEMCDPT